MPNISSEISAIQEAARGSEIRQPIVDALNVLNSGTLPQVSAQDAKKILCVNSQGQWVASNEQYVPTPTGTLSINENGTYNVADKAQAIVNIQGSSAVLVSKTISQNGSYNPSDDNADGYSGVTVNVQGGIVPTGSISISQNGVYDVTDKANAIVNVLPSLQALSVSQNGSYSPPIGYDGFSNVVVNVDGGESPVIEELTVSQNGTFTPPAGVDGYAPVVVSVSGGSQDTADFVIEKRSGYYSNSTASYIASSIFANNSGLLGVSFENCQIISMGAFQNCTSLSEAIFPNVSIVGQNAFSSCDKLEVIDFPKCTSINAAAFYGCSSLSSVNLPECEIISGTNAFGNCQHLETVIIPKCKNIPNNTFTKCFQLMCVSLLECSVIFSSAFVSCSHLESLYLMWSSVVSLRNANAFSGTPISNSSYLGYFGSIYVPASLVGAYKSAAIWSVYSNCITSYVEE